MPKDNRQTEVLDFWFRELTQGQWFGDGSKLDDTVRERFGELHEQAAAGELDGWAETASGRLALILLLDQFSRHIHRGTPGAFTLDAKAQRLAGEGIERGMDEDLTAAERQFFYMPLMHAENMALQDQSVEQFAKLKELGLDALGYAKEHRSQIARFDRFPGRNEALGRKSTPAELRFLET